MSAATNRKSKSTAVTKAKVPKTGTAVMIRQEDSTPKGAVGMMLALAQTKDFDAEKFKVMAAFQNDMVAQQAVLDFNRDFHLMWKLLPSINRDGKIVILDKATKALVQSTPYATFPNIMKLVKPILLDHGFTLNHSNSTEADGRPTVISTLRHASGYFQISSATLVLDTTGSKNNVQGYGSAVSYAKRYNTIGLLNLVSHASEDKDDDGQVAGNALMAPISADGLKTLKQKIKETDTDVKKFCDFWSINSLDELQLKNFEGAVRMLDQKTKKVAAS